MLANVNLKFRQATKDVTKAPPSQVKAECVCYFALLISGTFQTFSSGGGRISKPFAGPRRPPLPALSAEVRLPHTRERGCVPARGTSGFANSFAPGKDLR